MYKKIIAFFVIIATLITLIPPKNSSALSYLSDTDEHWAEHYITTLFNMDIMKGNDGKSLAENSITRGEFIALLIRSIYDTSSYTPKAYFNDVPKSHIFFSEVSKAKEMGIIIGKAGNTFGVDDHINREQAVIMISRLFDFYTADGSFNFNDIPKNYLYKTELDKAVSLGIIEGKTNGKFEPYSNLKRGECAKMILKILEIYGDKDRDETVFEVAKKYFYNPSLSNAIGKEKEEIEFKNKYISYANSLGVDVEKSISNEMFALKYLTSNTAEYEITYSVMVNTTYSDGSEKAKDYYGTFSIYLLRKNGEWKVYYTNENISLKEKVNLTWEIYQNPPSYAPEGLNVISPCWYEIISDNSFANSKTIYSDASLTLKLTDKSTQNYINYAKQNGYDLWIAYRNDFDKNNTEKFLKSDSARETALKLVLEGVLKNKAEGINLDFENMTNKYDYAHHVREVALAAHALGLIVSVDITRYEKTSGSWSMCFDRNYLATITDYTALMAYDQYGSWSTTSGPVASLSWVEDSINLTLNEVGNKKLILGIPFYVRYWKEKNGKVIKTGAISMDAANKMAEEANANITYSEKDGHYVASWNEDGYSYKIYLENTHSINKKTALVKKYNLAGVGSWRRGLETEDIWSVIDANLK